MDSETNLHQVKINMFGISTKIKEVKKVNGSSILVKVKVNGYYQNSLVWIK